jgi:hypothetical protein
MDSFASIQGGELPATPTTFTNVVGTIAGSAGNTGNQRAMRDLLDFLSGSLSQITQARYINNINATTWNDPLKEPYMVRDTIMKEFSLFAKDDWKVSQALTLNLGLRYDYYGVPFLGDGMTVGLTGGGGAIFGPSGGYSQWFAPIKQGDAATGSLVSLRSVGPAGQNSGETLYPQNWKNFGPAVGFAYQLPWLGKGKTTIRGGYQLSYISMAGNFSSIQSAAGQSPGFNYFNTWNNNGAWASGTYFGIKDLKTNSVFANGVPVPSTALPGLTTFPLYTTQAQSISAYAPDYKYPYVQNLTFAITRNVTSNLTVDLRYIGTLTRHNFSSKNLDTPNFLTNGLLGAFNSARAGQNPLLLDQLLNGVVINPYFGGCAVNGTTCHAGDQLRSASLWNPNMPLFSNGWYSSINQQLAMGNYQTLANIINFEATSPFSNPQPGAYMVANGFPVDFIKASPQFNSATLNENQGYSNYHSFQAQVTLRPTHGIYFQSTYTWSKNLGNSGGLSPDPRNLSTGYVVQGSDRPHNWVTYGNFDLPFGPGHMLLTNTHGALAKAIGGWQVGWISTVQSGSPLAMTANCGLYANCTPDIVNGGIDPSSIGLYWPSGAGNGSLFANRYSFVADPQCSNSSIVAPSLQSLCTLQAVKDSKSGQIVLQNPLPGTQGSMGYNTFRNLTRWNVDMSLSKSVAITETKSFRLRADISNIFNHPLPSGYLSMSGTRIVVPQPPYMSINGTNAIGLYTDKVGGRTLQATARFDF